MDQHARFEELALAHVLGGLARDDSDDFRSHLRSCASCRARVAELRGISSTLDAAAREERRRAAEEPPQRRDPAPTPQPRGPGRLAVLLLVAALVAGVGFWNLHLRTSADTYRSVAEDRGAILSDLATGRLVTTDALVPVAARVAVAGPRLAVVIADGGPLGSDERLVGWLLPLGSSPEEAVVLAVGPRATTEIAVRIERGGAREFVVTREQGLISSSGPRGDELFRVPLPSQDPGT